MSVPLRAFVALLLLGFVVPWCCPLHAQGVDPFDPFGGGPGGADPFDAGGDNPFGGPAPPSADDPFGGDPFGDPADADPFREPANPPAPRRARPAERVVKVAARQADGQQAGAEIRVWKELDEPTTLACIETPLSDVIDFLGDLHGITVRLDTRALEDVGIDADALITRNLRGVSLRSALRLTLKEMDLTYIVRDGSLLITTPEEAEAKLITKVYPVGRLLRSEDPLMDEDPWAGEELIDLVASTVRHTTWEDVGGLGSIAVLRNSLVVSNTMEVHEEVAEFLRALDQARKTVAEAKTMPPKIVSYPQPPAWKQRIHKALAEPVECDFHDTPLQDVAGFLADKAKINIQFDHHALEDVGLGTDTPITCKVKGISMAAALRLMLKEMDLIYVIRHEVLLITTPEEAELSLETRIFPVADLLLPSEDDEWLTAGPWDAAADYDSLIDLIVATVRPSMWEEVGGPGAIAPWQGSLVLSQTREVFEDIDRLLAGLRELSAKLRDNPRRIIAQSIRLDEIDSAAILKLREALAAEVGMLAYKETPLADLTAHIAEKHGVPILIDRRALEDIGIDEDQPITATLGGESLGQALRRILRELDCTYVLRDEVLLITTPEEAESELLTRIYPVGDLVLPWEDDAQLLTSGPLAISADFDSLIDTITSTVLVTSWEEVGGPGAVEPYHPALALVVSSTEEVHEAIDDLLAQVRKVEGAAKAQEGGDVEDATKDAPPAADEEVLTNKQGQRLHLKIYRLAKQDREHAGELAEVIRELVAPTTWEAEKSYYLRPLSGVIIVRHTAQTHRTIDRLLRELDAHQWPMFGGGGGGSAFGVDNGQGFDAGTKGGGFFSVPDHIQGQFGGGLGGISGGGLNFGPGRTPHAPSPVRTIASLSLPATEDRPAMPLRIYHQLHEEAAEIIEAIGELVEPDSWQADGAYLRAVDGKLIIRHQALAHRKVYRLLVEMGAIARPSRNSHWGHGGG